MTPAETQARQEMTKYIGAMFGAPKYHAPTGDVPGPEMLAFIRRNTTRNMSSIHGFDEAIARWGAAFPLKLTGNMVAGSTVDLSGHANSEY